jgi:hypothetical protein
MRNPRKWRRNRMAIQIGDLKTLYVQLDQAARLQTNLKEGMQIQQSLQARDMQKKAEEKIREISESQNLGEGAEAVKDENQHKRQQEGEERRRPDTPEEDSPAAAVIEQFRDPALGRNIDLSG